MLNGLGTTEMVLFGIIALMLFGSRLPEMARRFGGTYRDLRGKVDEFQKEFRDWDKVEPTKQTGKTFMPSEDDEPKKNLPSTPKFTPPVDDDDE